MRIRVISDLTYVSEDELSVELLRDRDPNTELFTSTTLEAVVIAIGSSGITFDESRTGDITVFVADCTFLELRLLL
mgnify:CR=1 FL=1|jgi:hypothetical protein